MPKKETSMVTVYTRNTCGPCRTVKHWLQSKNVEYVEKNIDENPELLSDIVEKTGMMVVPVILIDETVIAGANLALLSKALMV
jgi:glutaredoxin